MTEGCMTTGSALRSSQSTTDPTVHPQRAVMDRVSVSIPGFSCPVDSASVRGSFYNVYLCICLAAPCSMWDLSSLTRDWTHVPCIGSIILTPGQPGMSWGGVSSFFTLFLFPPVGEEIEMTPMVFAKGLADSGCWGDKLFGRLVSEELRGGGHGCSLRKASQAKVIYGLEPIFESGRTCIIKVSSLLVFGPSSETSLLGRNYDVTIQVLSHAPAPASTLSSLPFPAWSCWEAPYGGGCHLSLCFTLRRAWDVVQVTSLGP